MVIYPQSGTPASWSRTLALYATREVGAARNFTSLTFRPAHESSGPSVPAFVIIAFGRSVRRPDDIRTDFDANYVPGTRQVVLQAPLSLPSSGPDTWPKPFLPTLTFQASYPYIPAGSEALVVDIACLVQPSSRPWFDSWNCEYAYQAGSTVALALHQPTCLNSIGLASFSRQARASFAYRHATLTLNLFNYPTAAPSLATNLLAIGTTGPGGRWNGQPLPIALQQFGLPAQPTCKLAVAPLLTLPMSYTVVDGIGQLGLEMAMPNDPGLAGLRFFTQNLALDVDPATQAPLVFPSVTLWWQLGTSAGMPAYAVSGMGGIQWPTLGNLASAPGAPVLRLQ